MNRLLFQYERGLSHVLLAVLLVAVVTAIGFVGWRIEQNSAASSGSSSCMSFYKDQTLCNFAASNAHLGNLSYTAEDTSVNNMNQTTKITIKNDGKGNMSVFSQNGNQSYNTITMGNTVYVQNGASWIQYTNKAPSVSNPVTGFKADFSDSSTPASQQVKYKKLGQSTCGTATCNKYQILNPTWAGTNYIWISTSTNQLTHWQNKNSNGVNNLTISYGPVSITAPSPVIPASSAPNLPMQEENQIPH